MYSKMAISARDRRSLATARKYLTLPPDQLKALLELMQDSEEAGGLIACAANRFLARRIVKPLRSCPTRSGKPIS